MLYDTSDMDKGGPEDGDTAALAEGTQLCRTTQLRDMLHCLGGVSALLPLLSQLGAPPSEHETYYASGLNAWALLAEG